MVRRIYIEENADEGMVNLTPLIDVVFVVLIMFILVAPLVDVDRIVLAEAPQKQESIGAVEPSASIVIHVYADNTVHLNHKQVLLHDLKTQLLEVKRLHPGSIPTLYQDSASPFGTYQKVKNALEAAGFDQLDLVLQPGV